MTYNSWEGVVSVSWNEGTVSGGTRVGGIVGGNVPDGYTHFGSVDSCYNIGSISGRLLVGGIVGLSYDIVTNAYNAGAVTGGTRVGGIVGSTYSGNDRRCYDVGPVVGTDDDAVVGALAGELPAAVTADFQDSHYLAGSAGGAFGSVGEGYSASIPTSFTSDEPDAMPTFGDAYFLGEWGYNPTRQLDPDWILAPGGGYRYPVLRVIQETKALWAAKEAIDPSYLVFVSGESQDGLKTHFTAKTQGPGGTTLLWRETTTSDFASSGWTQNNSSLISGGYNGAPFVANRPYIGDGVAIFTAFLCTTTVDGNYYSAGTSVDFYIHVLGKDAKLSQSAPTGLSGTAPGVYGAKDGRISDTTAAMEYKRSDAASYTAVTGTSITGLAAGTYLLRFAAKTGYNAGSDATVVLSAGPNASQSAPRGLVPVAPSASGAKDGKISGTTATMEYRLSTASEYLPVGGTSIGGLGAGTYYLRFAAATGLDASPAVQVTLRVVSASDAAAVKKVEDEIRTLPSPGDVRAEDRTTIDGVREDYDGLDDIQKGLVDPDLKTALDGVVTALAGLEGSASPTPAPADPTTAVSTAPTHGTTPAPTQGAVDPGTSGSAWLWAGGALVLAVAAMLFFFLLWKRRKKDENEEA